MESAEIAVPLRELVNVVTLAVSLMFALFLFSPRFRKLPESVFLIIALLVMASIKLDQLYQMLGGWTMAPQYGFALAPLQWLMTPSLYFFVRAKTTTGFALRLRDSLHLLPFLVSLVYFSVVYYSLSLPEKLSLLQSGWLSSTSNRLIIPVAGDIFQLTYLYASLLLLRDHGMRLKDWFSSVEKREFRWLKRILILWGAVFLFHMGLVSFAAFGARISNILVILDIMNVIHLAIAIALPASAISDYFENSPSVDPISTRPRSSQMPDSQREVFFQQLVSFMTSEKPYLHADLSLKGLADSLAMTPRELSEVINTQSKMNFFEFINRYRVDEAKRILVEHPETRVLDVAFTAGFNSKSAFNDAFKKQTDMSPSAFRNHEIKQKKRPETCIRSSDC